MHRPVPTVAHGLVLEMYRLVLASESPRRRHLLEQAGYEFDVIPSSIDERSAPGEGPVATAVRLAMEKALAVAPIVSRESVVLAADTIVVLGERIYGKPRDETDAVRILGELLGRNHDVVTAWTLLPAGRPNATTSGFCRSTVRMREAGTREIAEYVRSGEPMDKAGAYAAQGEGGRFVAAVVGPLDNVIGLPLGPVRLALSELGIPARSEKPV
jgi:septum formation protein